MNDSLSLRIARRTLALLFVGSLFAACTATENAAPPKVAAPPAPSAPLADAVPAPTSPPIEAPTAAPAALPTSTPSADAKAALPVEAKPADVKAAAVSSGDAVYYDANGRGSCALAFGHDAAVISAPPNVYQHIQSCGACLEVTGPKGSAVVQVVDLCSTCGDNHLVINKPAFEQIAGKAVGKADITFKEVPCGVTGNLSVRIKESSSQYWTALQIRNHREPIKSVELKRGSDWVAMTRSNDNFFVAEKGTGTLGAFTIRITSRDGQVIEETLPNKWKDGQTYPLTAQLK
jgi:hypothetical protein